MEQEVKWNLGCYSDNGWWQLTLNEKPIGMPVRGIDRAKRMISWLAQAGDDIADAVSKELESND